MLREAVSPPIRASVYGAEPRQRVASLPGIVCIGVRDLVPDIPEVIHSGGHDVSAVRRATENALAEVDMSMIRPKDTVNILSSEHGFAVMGGEPYAEMIRTIKDIVQERTGCQNIRLRVSGGFHNMEPSEIIQYYEFDQYFNGRVAGLNHFSKGVSIETEIGTLYGVARAYDADWIIQAHYSDLRELYWHRLIDRTLKPFAMSYARFETRGVYHYNFGPRSATFVSRAIFDSPFIQEKYAFPCFMMVSPAGIIGIEADNDLHELDRRVTVSTLKSFGKLVRLFAEIEECIAVLDGAKWPMYIHGAGITFGNLVNFGSAKLDFFDLETVPAGTGFALFEKAPGAPKVKAVNPSIKALVINYAWTHMMCTELPINIPTILARRDVADMWITDSSNPEFMSFAVTAESIETAMEFARRIAGTDNIIVFDGGFGSINLSRPLAEFMLKKAPEVSRNVDEELLPKWLRQRGIDPQGL